MKLPRTCTQKALAELLGIHENTASNLRRNGVLVLSPDRRKVLLAESLRAYVAYVADGREADMTLAAAQKELLRLQSDKLRLANAQRSGELLPATMVQELQDSLVLQVRAAVEGMPARHAAAFADARAFQLLQTAAAEVISQVAAWLERQQAPMFARVAIEARERVRSDGVYDSRSGDDDDSERSRGAGAVRAVGRGKRDRQDDRGASQATPRPSVPRTRRTLSSRRTGRKR